MGIRMLNRRTAPSRAHVDAGPVAARRSVPALAADASTARIPTDLSTRLRNTVADLRRRLTVARTELAEPESWVLWATLLRGQLSTALARLPRPDRRTRSLTVFVADPVTTAGPSDDRPGS